MKFKAKIVQLFTEATTMPVESPFTKKDLEEEAVKYLKFLVKEGKVKEENFFYLRNELIDILDGIVDLSEVIKTHPAEHWEEAIANYRKSNSSELSQDEREESLIWHVFYVAAHDLTKEMRDKFPGRPAKFDLDES